MSPDRIDDFTTHGRRGEDATSPALGSAPRGWHLLAGLLFAPAAWILQTNVGQTIAAHSCFPHERPLTSPAWPWMTHALFALSAITLLIGIAGTVIASRNWQRTTPILQALAQHRPIARHAARDCFIARVGTISSCLFLFGLLAADMAALIVTPCGRG